MSSFEIFLIVGGCLAPVVALLFVLPKLKKKAKEPPVTTEYKPEKPVEEKKEELKDTKSVVRKPEQEVIKTSEFQDYLTYKRNNMSKPIRLNDPDIFTDDYIPSRLRRKQQKQETKTIAEQIYSLSPELKIMMLSGVFNKKDFDE